MWRILILNHFPTPSSWISEIYQNVQFQGVVLQVVHSPIKQRRSIRVSSWLLRCPKMCGGNWTFFGITHRQVTDHHDWNVSKTASWLSEINRKLTLFFFLFKFKKSEIKLNVKLQQRNMNLTNFWKDYRINFSGFLR